MAYDTAARSIAAKRGWVWRRALRDYTPSPETLAYRRLEALAAILDERAARRYTCDVAEAVLPLVAEQHRQAAADTLAAGRQLAEGGVSEYARRKAISAAIAMCGNSNFRTTDTCARQAVGWCTGRRAAIALRWSISYAVETLPEGDHLDVLHGHLRAIEALVPPTTINTTQEG